MTLVAVSPDHRVHVLPGMQGAVRDFTAGHPEYEWRLLGGRIVDGAERVVSMCRGDEVVVDGLVVAKLTADGFATAAMRVTISGGSGDARARHRAAAPALHPRHRPV